VKICLLGAGGGVGSQLVTQALAAGHELTVFLRPDRQLALPSAVRVVRGRLDQPELLHEALQGSAAVVSSIGMQRRQPANPWSAALSAPDLTSASARQLVAAMQAAEVPRIVAVSAAGVGESAAQLNGVMRFFLATTMIGTAYRDLDLMERVYRDSGLDWLCPRPTRLTNGPLTGRVGVVEAFSTRAAIARADVAHWMLAALAQPVWPLPEWGGRCPQITGI
jgi:putative NADH-flavin reductase